MSGLDHVAARVHPRIAIFTHDAYGLGHVRRSLQIARALSDRACEPTILLITGCPASDVFKRLPPRTDYLRIPTIARPGGAAPALSLGLPQVTMLRRRLIREAVLAFDPDAFLVDNFPLGARLELLPTLQALRHRRTTTVLGLRDIADPPERVRSDWTREDIYDVLDRCYDRILVYGTREVFDIVESYELPPAVAAKVHYCGYVTASAGPSRTRGEVRAELGDPARLVLATVGGGGDGFPLLAAVIEAAPLVNASLLAVTGELMGPPDRERLRALAGATPAVIVRDWLPDLPCYMAAADVVVAMGGYNTTAELLALGVRPVIVPRTWRAGEHESRGRARIDAEQLIRAQALSRLGLVDMVEPDELRPETVAERINAALDRARRPGGSIDVHGAEAAAGHLLGMIGLESEGCVGSAGA